MTHFFKWSSLLIAVVSIPLIVLLLYASAWLSAATWAVLGVTGYINYCNLRNVIKYETEINARLEQLKNDYRS